MGEAILDLAFSQIEDWITRRTASIAASEPGSDFSYIADSDDISPTVEQNLGTEGSVVWDLEVHESVEVSAKMAHQVTPMAAPGDNTNAHGAP